MLCEGPLGSSRGGLLQRKPKETKRNIQTEEFRKQLRPTLDIDGAKLAASWRQDGARRAEDTKKGASNAKISIRPDKADGDMAM